MDAMFPGKSCNMDASLDSSGADDMIPSANDFGIFLPTAAHQGLTESDIAKNIKCNVMMNDAQDDKSTIFSFTNDSSPGKKDTFAMEDPSLLMVNDNSLDTFDPSKLGGIMAVKEGIPGEILHRSSDSLSLIDPYGPGSSVPGGPSPLGIEFLEDSVSGRGTPVMFRKFEDKELSKVSGTYPSSFLHKMNQDDIMDNFSDLPESRCVKPSEIHSQPVMIKSEPKDSIEKPRQRKPSGSKKTSVKPKIAIQDQTSVSSTLPSSPTVTSSFVININKSAAKITPQITQKLNVPKLPAQATITVAPQLSRLRMKHPIITGILGIPPKGPVWQIPNLFGPGLVQNKPPTGSNSKLLEKSQIKLEKTAAQSDQMPSPKVSLNTFVNVSAAQKISDKINISKPASATTSSTGIIASAALPEKITLNRKEVGHKSPIQGILVTDKTTFISDRSPPCSSENQSGFMKKKSKETMAELAIKKLLTAKTTELYKGSNLQLTLPITPESEGEDHGAVMSSIELGQSSDKRADSSDESSSTSHLNKTLVENYMQNWKPTGKYSCTECPYSSVTRNYLFRHWSMKHTEIKPYQCPYCDVDMGFKDGVTRHQVSNHRGKPRNVIIDYTLENKLVEEFAEIFGENILEPIEKSTIRDRTNTDSDAFESEFSSDSLSCNVISKNIPNVPPKEQQKVHSQATLASIALPILPAIMNRDSIAISAAVALQSAVLSLTQAGKTSTPKPETVKSHVHPILSTQLKKNEAVAPVIVIPDDVQGEVGKKGSAQEQQRVVKAQKRPIVEAKPMMFKIARVESIPNAGKIVKGTPNITLGAMVQDKNKNNSPLKGSPLVIKKESSHTTVKS